MSNEGTDENIIRTFKEVDYNYENIDKDRLILYTVWYLENKGIEPTLQKIIATAFKLFPKSFSLLGFPEYPDGYTVYYVTWLHNTKTKKLLEGSVQSGFALSEKGKYVVEEIQKILTGEIEVIKKYRKITKTKEVTFIEALKKTAAYIKFEANRSGEISESEIFEAVRVQTNPKSFSLHLNQYVDYAKRIGDSDVLRFLIFIKEKIGDKYG